MIKKILIILIWTLVSFQFVNAKDIELSIKEAQNYLKNGEYKKACDILKEIKNDKLNLQKEFILGQCKYALQDFTGSAYHYELMLEHNTNLPRVRLDLAKTLMSMSKGKAAKEEFAKVLAMDLPKNVKSNILKQIESINYRKRWGGVVSFGYQHNSNINSAPSDPNILAFGLPFVLDKNSIARKGNALLSSLSVGKYFDAPLSDEWRLDIFGDILEYVSEDPYDSLSVGATLSSNYYFGKTTLTIPLTYRTGWEGEDFSTSTFSITPSLIYNIQNSTQVISTLSYTNEDGQTEDGTLDGHIYGVGLNIRHNLNQSNLIEAGIRFSKNNANELRYERYSDSSVNISYSKNFINGVGISLNPAYSILDYKDSDPIDDGVVREDKRIAININLYKNMFIKDFSFIPILAYTYTNNSSNIKRRDYEKHQISLQVRKQF